MDLISQFKAARRSSAPLVAVLTPDPASTMEAIGAAVNGGKPLLSWDIVRGLVGLNASGKEAIFGLGVDPSVTVSPTETLSLALKLPPGAVLFFLQTHRVLRSDIQGSEAVSQGVWNLRDAFKTDRRTLVLLAPELDLPAELRQDVLTLEEPLPGDLDLEKIILDQFATLELPTPAPLALSGAVDATRGLSSFAAEQVIAMSLTRSGVDVPALWERKRRMIEQAPGLSVWRGGERFEDIGGVENAKGFLRRVMAGKASPRAICFIDEIEKALAGAASGQDSTGVSQDQLAQLLTYMQDRQASGLIFIGPPGSGKSAVAKAAGNEAGIPTISLDLGGMKGSLVGQSEANLRQALRVLSAVAGEGGALFIATCNKIADLPPELRRRFKLGTFFFDLPDAKERGAIWRLYLDKYRLPSGELPDSSGWTGAEIASCCEIAWRLNCFLLEAARYIVPVAISAKEQIDRLRGQASGRFISASYPGPYRLPDPGRSKGRAIDVEDI